MTNHEEDLEGGLEEAALREMADDADTYEGASSSGMAAVERCPHCNRPMDDIENMSEVELLDQVRINLIKDLARNLRAGTITHQEMVVARGLLRDNSFVLNKQDAAQHARRKSNEDPTPDPELDQVQRSPSRARRFLDEGEGG